MSTKSYLEIVENSPIVIDRLRRMIFRKKITTKIRIQLASDDGFDINERLESSW